jgi:hypothetical protein
MDTAIFNEEVQAQIDAGLKSMEAVRPASKFRVVLMYFWACIMLSISALISWAVYLNYQESGYHWGQIAFGFIAFLVLGSAAMRFDLAKRYAALGPDGYKAEAAAIKAEEKRKVDEKLKDMEQAKYEKMSKTLQLKQEVFNAQYEKAQRLEKAGVLRDSEVVSLQKQQDEIERIIRILIDAGYDVSG